MQGKEQGGRYGHVLFCRCVGGCGIPDVYRFGWFYWSEALDRIGSRSQFANGT